MIRVSEKNLTPRPPLRIQRGGVGRQRLEKFAYPAVPLMAWCLTPQPRPLCGARRIQRGGVGGQPLALATIRTSYKALAKQAEGQPLAAYVGPYGLQGDSGES